MAAWSAAIPIALKRRCLGERATPGGSFHTVKKNEGPAARRALSGYRDRLDAHVATMQGMMEKAGEYVAGIPIRTDAKVVRWPDRYMDERGQAMWDRVLVLLDDAQKAAA
jgi:hypothetical protein